MPKSLISLMQVLLCSNANGCKDRKSTNPVVFTLGEKKKAIRYGHDTCPWSLLGSVYSLLLKSPPQGSHGYSLLLKSPPQGSHGIWQHLFPKTKGTARIFVLDGALFYAYLVKNAPKDTFLTTHPKCRVINHKREGVCEKHISHPQNSGGLPGAHFLFNGSQSRKAGRTKNEES